MTKARFASSSIIVVFASIYCVSALAQIENNAFKTDWTLTTYVESRYDDNAFRASKESDEEKRGELQNFGSIQINGLHTGYLTEIGANYQVTQGQYTRDSQRADANLTGLAQVKLGNEKTYYGLDAEHSVRQVLTRPDEEFVAANTQQQETLTISPSLKTREDKPDSFILSGIFSTVRFEDEIRSDTTQAGYSLGWLHKLPRVYEIGVNYTDSNIDFSDFESLNYELERVEAFLQSKTRFLEYYISLGRDKITPDIDVESEGNFHSVTINYQYFGSVFQYEDRKEFSDTSFASGISDVFTGFDVGGDLTIQDQVEITTRQLNWINNSICQSCEFTLGYNLQEIEYVNLGENDSKASLLFASFGYQIVKNAKLTASYSTRNVEFLYDASRDVESEILQFSYDQEIIKNLSANAFIRFVDRKADANPYESNVIGIRVIKIFD